MASVNRADLLIKTHKVLKKHYKAANPAANRTALEHLLFACCLENSPPDAAEAAYETIFTRFFDLNEVRVTSVRELGEVFHKLNDPQEAGARVKTCLHSIFESLYSFDLEFLKKLNIGQAVKKLEDLEGTTPFVVAYVNQAALGGHSIPVNRGALEAFVVLDVISEAEAAKYKTPGLERAIPKSKGVEFGSLLQQFGAALSASPFSQAIRNILIEINPDCKERLPKRRKKADVVDESETEKEQQAPTKKKTASKTAKSQPTGKKQKQPKPKPAAKKKAGTAKGKTDGSTKKSPTKRLGRRKPR